MTSAFLRGALTLTFLSLSLAASSCSLSRSVTPPGTGMDGGPGSDSAVLCTAGGCDDGNACTDDACDPASGCLHTANAATCDDGVLCNGHDSCAASSCSQHDGVDPCPGASACDAASDSCLGCLGVSDCPAPMTGDWSACAFPTGDVCATSGTRSRVVTSYACSSGACEATTAPESEACDRTTDGVTCAPIALDDWSACVFLDACTTAGTMTRSVTASTCAAGTCAPSTTTESMACTRGATDGSACGTVTMDPYGPCVVGASCSTDGLESRMVTTPTCQAGSCMAISTTESRACTMGSTDGSPCGMPTCGAFGSCVPNTTDTCETQGTQTRTCTTASCAGGVCSGSMGTMQTQACTVPPGAACTSRFCTMCRESGTTVRCRPTHFGTRTCTMTSGTCSGGGTCLGAFTVTSESCSCPP